MNGLLKKIRESSDDIIIYGAGGVAKDLVVLLKSMELNLKLSLAVLNLENNPDEILGVPVMPIDSLDVADDYIIIIATMPGIARNIKDDLKEKGFPNIHSIEEFLDSLYEEIWKDPIDNNKIVFSHFGGIGYGGNGKYVSEELKKCPRKADVVWGIKSRNERGPLGVHFVEYGTYEYYRELGTAHIWVDDQHKNYLSRKRDGQVYIQTWHGVGPIKKIEHDADTIPSSYLELCDYNSSIEDYFISASGFNSEQYRRAFHYYGEIIECGYPGNDIFFGGFVDAEHIKDDLGIEDKRVILYAPTFREGNKKVRPDYRGIINAFNKRFGKEHVLLIRFHPNDKENDMTEYGETVINVTCYADIQELLFISDALITDYSSVMWDFSLQRRPVFLFHPDNSKYQEERGNYLKFSEMPYIEAVNDCDLVDKIMTYDNKDYLDGLEEFFGKYKSFDTGNATKHMTEMILDIIDNAAN